MKNNLNKRKFKNTVSIECHDHTIKMVFIEKLKTLGFLFNNHKTNISMNAPNIWINEIYEGDYYGDGKIRLAYASLNSSPDEYPIYFELPKDFYEALDACTELNKHTELKLKLNYLNRNNVKSKKSKNLD